MGTMKRGLLAVVASSLVLLTVGSVPAFCQEDASTRPYTPVTEKMMTTPPATDWLQYGRTYDGHHYSPLKQITTANVKSLEPIWSFSTGVTAGHEVVPVEHDGVLFITTSYNKVFALDARSGKFLWKYERDIPDKALSVVCCDVVNKGGLLYGDNFYFGTIDAHVVALNAKTGALVFDTKVAEYADGITITNAPLYVKGNIISGMTGGEFGARGRLIAVNAETGKIAWITYTVPGPGEPGSDTWGGTETYKHGGGTTWSTGVYDPKQNLIFWGTGNPGPWAGTVRPGDNVGTVSTIAFDGDTGAIKGQFQYIPHDLWDYDNITPPVLVDVVHNGKKVEGIWTSHKHGYNYLLDRTNFGPGTVGNIKFVYGEPFMPVTFMKGLDKNGRPIPDPLKDPTDLSLGLVDVCPSFLGGTNLMVPAYEASTSTAFISGNFWCETIKGLTPEPWVQGKAYVQAEFHMHVQPGAKGAGGFIKAIDVKTGKTKWTKEMEDPNWSGLLATSGGVLFGGGTASRDFFALDAKTGTQLWKFRTNSGLVGAPITYELDGVQYVATVSGFGGAIPIWTGEIKDKYTKDVPQGGVVWVFALKGASK
jgi:alcohol dehydrogenase (cytochrome c)